MYNIPPLKCCGVIPCPVVCNLIHGSHIAVVQHIAVMVDYGAPG